MTVVEDIKLITEAYKKSVTLKEIGIQKGWDFAGPPSEWPKETDEESLDRREFDCVVDVPGIDLEEARAALDADKSFYWEGGTMCGSNLYDLMLTPMDLFNERGICTEVEGHVRVVIDKDKPIVIHGPF